VHNLGPALAPDTLPHLFEPFWRGESARLRDGLGLGLYISHRLVEAHGGRIDVRSSAEEGTTFTVTLPTAQPTAEDGTLQAPADTS
jgi:signal transduction histidine kinase